MPELQDLPDGARVVKPNAIVFDFAWGKVGTIVSEEVDGRCMRGVVWDGGERAYEYGEDTVLEIASSTGSPVPAVPSASAVPPSAA
jgi:hypothetical protein